MNRTRGRPRRSSDAPAAVGQRIELTLQRLTHDGRGIGSWQGRTVFVEGGLPGELVTARVVRARSKLIEARLDTLRQPAPERVEPRCRHADLCGGCNQQHIAHDLQITIKQQTLAQQLQHFAGLQPERWMPPLLGPAYGYRQRTRLAMRWDARSGRLEVGYRQRASSDLVEISECPILAAPLEALIKALPDVLRSLDARQSLGHVELIGGLFPALVVRHLRPLSANDLTALGELAQQHQVSLWLQGSDADQPTPEGAAQTPAYALDDQQLRFEFAPGDFTQVNADINQAMVNQAIAWLGLQPGERVLDLYCGVGNFSLPLARQGAFVAGIEGSDEMVLQAQHNAGLNALAQTHFCQADLSKRLADDVLAQRYHAALLDPPRDGAETLVAALAEHGIGRILYVSCNPATLARDAGVLAGKGYRLVQAGIMDMFPQTAHVEAMALFVSGKDKS
ncbi:23S rRNA (uracil(1939)-C(5))-methyltransferase RlmD [Halopseudomonas nanhaiensis]|uniref:23S rRNA (uracil(1939)-C(5))-methyltransferase RlmD n=1 Tax=Halopseudomonas nanhaiensis TaxID=2830842 RepID=UPI001CBB1BB3|nr:23S rRNA (uracil(1939)-C(5))-methyltransferase RlmD [Halopseudomonas nanhaiensis]UAW97706.1 23S rRNA (uracil(1939)-C(5))-methyltransferase RlmD [Halopseudomonas nanhaiensis]